MKQCPRCGAREEMDEAHVLCYSCYGELVDWHGSSENTVPAFRALATLVGLPLDFQEWKELADSAAGQDVLDSLLEEMDGDMFAQLIRKHLKLRGQTV